MEGFADLAPDLALSEVVTLLNRLAKNPDFLDAYVLPLLEEPGEAEDWYVAYRYEGEVLGEGRAAFNWACEYPDGTRVLAAATVELRDGEIVRQVMVEASDEYPQGTRSLRDWERIPYGYARRTRQSERSYDHGGRHYRCP